MIQPLHEGAASELSHLEVTVAGRTLLQVGRLRINPGERVAIVGPNGAGKSTLLRVMAGQLLPRAGHVQVLGRAWGTLANGQLEPILSPRDWRALRSELGLVMQGLHLVPRLSARENVLVGALSRLQKHECWRGWLRWYPPVMCAQADTVLAQLGLATRAQARADRLSGGERQKVSVARLQLQQPRLVLADEPTSALDPLAVHQVCALLQDAAGPGAMLTVTHHRDLLPLLATRVLGMARGRIVWDLPLTAVTDPLLDSLYRDTDSLAGCDHYPKPNENDPSGLIHPLYGFGGLQ